MLRDEIPQKVNRDREKRCRRINTIEESTKELWKTVEDRVTELEAKEKDVKHELKGVAASFRESVLGYDPSKKNVKRSSTPSRRSPPVGRKRVKN